MDDKDLLRRVAEAGVEFLSLQFTDVTGAVKTMDVPAHRIESALEDGGWFDGSSIEGFARIQESDMRLVVDTDTYAVLPWSPAGSRRARVFCDIFLPGGQPFLGDPRGALKRALERLGERGWTYNVGPEPEFFLFKQNGPPRIHPVPHAVGGYFDFSASGQAVRASPAPGARRTRAPGTRSMQPMGQTSTQPWHWVHCEAEAARESDWVLIPQCRPRAPSLRPWPSA